MALGYVRIHEGLYLVYHNGKQRFEIDNDEGDWQITVDGERRDKLWFKGLPQAKQALENLILREIDQ